MDVCRRYSAGRNPEEMKQLVKICTEAAKRIKMEINVNKCKTMIRQIGITLIKYSYKEIEIVALTEPEKQTKYTKH